MKITAHELRESLRHVGDPAADTFTDEELRARYEPLGYRIEDEHPLHREQREKREAANAAEGEALGLTGEEVQAAKDAGMTPERWQRARDARNIDEWRAMNRPPTLRDLIDAALEERLREHGT